MFSERTTVDFSKELKNEREKRNLTHADVAKAIDIHAGMIGRYEKDKEDQYAAHPSQLTWRKLNEFFFPNSQKTEKISLSQFSIEEIVEELKEQRGATSVSIVF
ncbi:hypothetical protein P256_02616 [Acinetobacter nectaris CIP 110549]|uniref:HTH cro/C1-type domain-containing protein n=1 Tax=Acinetobacter nectaris CIP 110549 TaxID=1392540 RepID=V2UHI7_9GAMM|nr:helix-turn-helix transcriptional regulator [Acinetobacter nectaris]ESK34674.1 hypothetical protein P256_02616 [Acinetobacter nectaris CIP 110549]